MPAIIVTNNEKVKELERADLMVECVDISYRDVLVKVRDYVHRGHVLISHPLAGSLKPKETPFRSVIISDKSGQLDMRSLEYIENAIVTCDKFTERKSELPDSIREDFAVIDFTLIKGAVSDRQF